MSDDRQYVNGQYFDFSSIEIELGGRTLRDFLSVNYSDTLTPQQVRSASPMPRGRTRGDYQAQGSLTMTRGEYQELISALGDGFGESVFDVVVSYADGDKPPTVDRLIGCRISGPSSDHSQGGGALQISVSLDVLRITYDSKSLVGSLSV